jgi:hypothetical protein
VRVNCAACQNILEHTTTTARVRAWGVLTDDEWHRLQVVATGPTMSAKFPDWIDGDPQPRATRTPLPHITKSVARGVIHWRGHCRRVVRIREDRLAARIEAALRIGQRDLYV